MNFYAIIFCFFLGSIGIDGVKKTTIKRYHEQIAADLNDPIRWNKELSEFETGLEYRGHKISVDDGRTFPTDLSVSPDDLKFLLYTRSNPDTPDVLTLYNISSIRHSHFDTQERTIFVTHGFFDSSSSHSCTYIRDAYLKSNYNPNVIVIDWHAISSNILYPIVAAKVPKVGSAVAVFINYLSVNNYLVISDTILVGHSLGAHVVGIAGYRADGTPKAVFGLDPALPLFGFSDPGRRISDQDAKHVQIIHTNAGGLGTNEFWGHVSFLMDGGVDQPGCLGLDTCSHWRAFYYFAESITTDVGFYGEKCTKEEEITLGYCVNEVVGRMGGYLPDKKLENGRIYNVNVKLFSPYAMGDWSKITIFFRKLLEGLLPSRYN